MTTPAFGPELFTFLRQLRANNDRSWFAANKERYERDVRDPMLAFIREAATPLARISRQTKQHHAVFNARRIRPHACVRARPLDRSGFKADLPRMERTDD